MTNKPDKCTCGCTEINLWTTVDRRTIVACVYCRMETRPYESEEDAIDAWNRLVAQ